MSSHDLRGVRIFLVEPHLAVRTAVAEVLRAEGAQVETCESLEEVLHHASGGQQELVLIAWQSMNGLLSDEHRPDLQAVTRRLRLVLSVPWRWARMLSPSELGVAGLIAKPFNADELVAVLAQAARAERVAS